VLRGPRFRRLFPDVYARADVPVDLALRAQAASLLVPGRGVVGDPYPAGDRLNDLPVPLLQHPLGPFLLDLAYPGIRLAIEYDGEIHRTQERAMRDLARQAYLSDAGWTVLRFTAADVMCRPWWVAARVREELIKAARRRGVTLDALQLY
jgi:very-short-patch-repair endonuclease